MQHEKYNKKAVVVALFMVVVIIVAAAVLFFSKKSPQGKNVMNSRPAVGTQQAPSQVAAQEDTVTVKNKDDAKKALNELDSLVDSEGDVSL